MYKIKLISACIFFLISSCKEKQETVGDLIDRGVDSVNEKKFVEGIKIYSNAILKNPRIQLAYYNRGIAYSEINKYDSALADFNKVIDLQTVNGGIFWKNPEIDKSDEAIGQVPYNDVLFQRAIVKSNMDSLKSSFIDFEMLIRGDYEDKSSCFLWQGILLGRSGKHEKACDYFKKAKENAFNEESAKEAEGYISKHCK